MRKLPVSSIMLPEGFCTVCEVYDFDVVPGYPPPLVNPP